MQTNRRIGMNTREIATEYRLGHWAQITKERVESGQSIRAYCQGAGIHENVYYYWQRKLREAACEQIGLPGFSEVRITERQPQGEPTSPGHGQMRIEVNGLQITVDGGYPIEQLSALLKKLSELC